MVIFGRTSALLLAMDLLLLFFAKRINEGLRLPEASQCAKFTRKVLVAGAGFEPTTQRL